MSMDALPFLSLLKGRDLHDIIGGVGIFMRLSGIGDIVVVSKLYFCQMTGLYWSRLVHRLVLDQKRPVFWGLVWSLTFWASV